MDENSIKIFEDKNVRTIWDETQEKWFVSIVDVIEILTESVNPRKYWSVLKTRLKKEGSQLATNCSQLKMKSSDGKMRLTDVARVAKEALEEKTGKKVVTSLNAKAILEEQKKLEGEDDE